MKRIIAIMLIVLLSLSLASCNYTMFDTKYNFEYAIIKLPNGEIVEGEVYRWVDYDGEQLQITFKDGNTYLTCSINAVLMEHMPTEKENADAETD